MICETGGSIVDFPSSFAVVADVWFHGLKKLFPPWIKKTFGGGLQTRFFIIKRSGDNYVYLVLMDR